MSVQSSDEWSGEDPETIGLELSMLLSDAHILLKRIRARASSATTGADDTHRASKRAADRLLSFVQSASAEMTERRTVEIPTDAAADYIACVDAISRAIVSRKAKIDKLERDTVPESFINDMTAKYNALQLDKQTLEETLSLVETGQTLHEVGSQFGLSVSYNYEFTLDQNWLDTGRTFKRAYDALLPSCDGHTSTTEYLVSLFLTVYTEDKADVDTELIAEELGSDDIDAALPSVGSTPDQYEKLKQVLQTEGVTGVIVRREGAAELAQSIGRALGVI